MKRKNKIFCNECGRDDFKSDRGIVIHKLKKHPYIPPPPPKKTTWISPSGLPYISTLKNGKNMGLGDTFVVVSKYVIKKITKTEGSENCDVEADLVKLYWKKQ